MDMISVVKRAWKTLWRYRALWVWGIVLALTAASWPAWTLADLDELQEGDWEGITITVQDGETFRQAFRRTLGAEIDEANRELSALLTELLHVRARVSVIALFVALVTLTLLLRIVGRIARYVSEVALIREVDHYQASGERRSVWQALRQGWSRSAWRLFLINVSLGVLGTAAALLLFGALFAPIALWVNGGEAIIFTFAFLTGGLFFVVLVAVILMSVALSVLKRLAWRACALDGRGVFASIQQGYRTFTKHLEDAGAAWLVTAAVRWGWRAAIVPVVLTLVGVGLLTGSMPGLLVGGVTNLFSGEGLAVALALAVGIPLFLLVLLAPLVWLAGLREVFTSATWTLAYREMRAQESQVEQPAPAVEGPGLKTAPAVS